jgi:protein-S-isoprenylcysteine O-methyltransferase Ste14
LFDNKYRFFPPATTGSWQYYLFWCLFRIFIIGHIWLSIVGFNGSNAVASYMLGLPLLAIGLGFACYISYITLGQTNSYGGKAGLRTQGFYRYSRNHVYGATIIGMLGWGLLVNSLYTWVLLGLWLGMYLLAPLIEEPWLEQAYAEEYTQYKLRVPRFIGFLKK